ncbi:chaperone NapD [Amaricoccus sp.]|uniref:chaperone NapD n=1 Tax=Amaricoccus sp. TaxID=1872485 RepID=UPI001B5AB74E|nr:chaperone NapD [Amaricoccus sp.]MBP7001988.1 chaperone NapD [Amaricoccus sp.]
MPANASPAVSRRSLLGLPEDSVGHISSLVVRARPDRVAGVAARIARLPVAEVALSDPATGKIVVALETRDEDEIVAAMNAMQRMAGVVSVALVFHHTDA